jgi:2-phospho-L-lactate guanylyltransferase (CobY/MobA/RfbA family)
VKRMTGKPHMTAMSIVSYTDIQTAKDLIDCMTLCVMHNERNSSMEALSKAIAV